MYFGFFPFVSSVSTILASFNNASQNECIIAWIWNIFSKNLHTEQMAICYWKCNATCKLMRRIVCMLVCGNQSKQPMPICCCFSVYFLFRSFLCHENAFFALNVFDFMKQRERKHNSAHVNAFTICATSVWNEWFEWRCALSRV